MDFKRISDRKVVGWLQIVTAFVSFAVIFVISGYIASIEELNPWIFITLVMPFAYLLAGLGLLKHYAWAWLLSLILQLMAVLDISIGDSFSWYWDPGVALSLSINLNGIGVGIDFLSLTMLILLVRMRR